MLLLDTQHSSVCPNRHKTGSVGQMPLSCSRDWVKFSTGMAGAMAAAASTGAELAPAWVQSCQWVQLPLLVKGPTVTLNGYQ